MGLKEDTLRIAAGLPKGDVTRRKLLAALTVRIAKPLPRATNRPPGPKFREQLCDWVRADAQEKLEAAGVPQKNIDAAIRAVCQYGLLQTSFRGYGPQNYQFFETQEEAVAFLAGKLDIDIGATGGMRNYPAIINHWIQEYGAGVGGYRDKVKALLNKLSPQQQALAYWAWTEGQFPRKQAEQLVKSLDDSSKEHYETMIPILEWALKVPQAPKK